MTAAVSLVLVVACLAWLGSDQLSEPDVQLMGGEQFSATQLRAMESAFGKAGLTDYCVEQGRICVARSRQAKYMAALVDEEALPADFGQYLRESVQGSGFLVYGSRQEAQTKVAIQSELQLTISNLKGIEKASVHIAEETTRGLRPQKNVTASVALLPQAGQTVDEATAAVVRHLVASTWGASLKPESVTVVDLSTKRLFPCTGDASTAPGSSYAATKKKLEIDWQEKVTRVLGIAGALVAANVELDAQSHAPRSVNLSVAVPQAHYEQVWRSRHPGAAVNAPEGHELHLIEQEESAKIRAAVLPLLGSLATEKDGAAQVAVSTIHSSAAPASSHTVYRDRALQWLALHWQSLGVAALLLAALWMLRGTLEKTHPLEPGTEATPRDGLFLVTDHPPESMVADPAPDPSQPQPHDPWREELAGIVRQDPRAAASVLKTWIGNAS